MYIDKNQKRKVAIYARVSTEHEAQLYALDNQIDWYNDIFDRYPNWELVEKYVDRGITGTSATKRPSFMRMIQDAEDGDFDLIITREVSRFARNTVDTLSYTRQLKKWNVEVYFVEDNIWTYDPDGELRLTIMATLAQDESRKTSIRVKAGQRSSMEKGVFFQNGSVLGYNYDKNTRELTINQEQAETVRMIFDLYNSGLGLRKVQWELEKEGRRTAKGSSLWSCSVISRVLKNKLYAGYLVWHKQYVPDFLEQKKINNHGEIDQFEVLGTHEPIVTLEEWEEAQSRLNSHQVDNGGQRTVRSNADVWGKKLICSCGSKFQRQQYHRDSLTGKIYYSYRCYNTIKSGSIESRKKKGLPTEGMCGTPAVTRWKLEAMAYYIFKNLIYNKEVILLKAEKAIKTLSIKANVDADTDRVLKYKKDIDKYNQKIDNLVELYTDGSVNKEIFIRKKTEFEKIIGELEEKIAEIGETKKEVVEQTSLMDLFKMMLDRIDNMGETKQVPEYLIDALVEYILVDGDTFKWKLRLIPDTYDLGVEGSREINYTIKDKGENNHAVCSTLHRRRYANSIIKNPLKILDFCMTKEITLKCLNLNPKDRLFMRRNMYVEIYI